MYVKSTTGIAVMSWDATAGGRLCVGPVGVWGEEDMVREKDTGEKKKIRRGGGGGDNKIGKRY